MLFWIYYPDFEQRCLMYYTKLYTYIWVKPFLEYLSCAWKIKAKTSICFYFIGSLL